MFWSAAQAQEKPPVPITVKSIKVNSYQGLNFGTLIPTRFSGASVTIPPSLGSPFLDGVIELGASHSPALFEVESIPGTLVMIEYITLPLEFIPNSNAILTLTNVLSSPASPFITIGDRTEVYIGGTLTIGNLTGSYSGTYTATLFVKFTQIQQ